jgi:Flp pilus assembly protein CpaB
MRNKQNKKKMIIAIMLSIIAGFIVYNSMNGNKATIDKLNRTLEAQQQTIKKLESSSSQENNQFVNQKLAVAKKDLKAGEKLTLDMIELKESTVQKDMPDAVNDLTFLLGQTLAEDVVTGALITKSKLLGSKSESFDIPTGMRAITIPSSSIQGMASYITVGSKIDIISAKKENNSEFLIQGAKIISFEGANTTVSGSVMSKYDGITILVPVSVVPRLVDAMSNGKLQIVARGYGDNKVVKTFVRTNKYLTKQTSSDFSVPPPPDGIKLPGISEIKSNSTLVSSEKSKARVVEVIQANVKTDVSFE